MIWLVPDHCIMAEDNDNEELSAEVNLLINRLQHLVSSSDSSQDEANTQIKALEFIFSVITQRYKGYCIITV